MIYCVEVKDSTDLECLHTMIMSEAHLYDRSSNANFTRKKDSNRFDCYQDKAFFVFNCKTRNIHLKKQLNIQIDQMFTIVDPISTSQPISSLNLLYLTFSVMNDTTVLICSLIGFSM